MQQKTIPVGITMAASVGGTQTRYEFAGQAGLDSLSVLARFTAPTPVDFAAALVSAPIDSLALDEITATPYRLERTPELIAAVPWDIMYFSEIQKGEFRSQQDGHTAISRPGQMTFQRSAAPYEYETSVSNQTASIGIPIALLHGEGKRVPLLTSQNLPQTPSLRVFAGMLTALQRGTPEEGSRGAESIAAALVDLTRVCISEFLDTRLDPDEVQEGMRVRIRDYINRNLGDPQLGPESIAGGLKMSVRYLHKLFESENQTVARYVRTRRVNAIAKTLRTDPNISFGELSAKYGFGSTETARNAFMKLIGSTPKDYQTHSAATTESLTENPEA